MAVALENSVRAIREIESFGTKAEAADCSSWIELSASALRHNVHVFRNIGAATQPQPGVGVVLKGNAYGHGFDQVLPAVHQAVDAIYVITPQDGLAVRAYERASGRSARQVVVIGAVGPKEAVELSREGVDAVVADSAWAEAIPLLRASGLALRVHVHLETGLGREGFSPGELARDLAFLVENRDVFEPVGVLSHFANVEDVTEQAYAQQQVRAFERGLEELQTLLKPAKPLQRHMAASAATLILPESRMDLTRVGISLYGLWPSNPTRLSARVVMGEVPLLRPVLSWRCRSQSVKLLPAGSYVGYGCTYRCTEPTRVAVLPVGYFDGYPRLASGRAHVLVNGQRCPVLGRVMMNHVMVDVTRASPDERPVVATLIGQDGEEQVSADMLATWADTIHYEIVTRLGAHLRRNVVE
jgi:alanine racemase